jgi:hypothetical protein
MNHSLRRQELGVHLNQASGVPQVVAEWESSRMPEKTAGIAFAGRKVAVALSERGGGLKHVEVCCTVSDGAMFSCCCRLLALNSFDKVNCSPHAMFVPTMPITLLRRQSACRRWHYPIWMESRWPATFCELISRHPLKCCSGAAT